MDIKKKSNLLSRTNSAQPEVSFDRNKIYSVTEKTIANNNESNKGKRTSLSVFQDTKNMIQAIITLSDARNADDVINMLINNYIDIMSEEEINEFKRMKKTLDNKTIGRGR